MGIQQIITGVLAPAGSDYYGETWPNVGGVTLHGAYLFGNGQKMDDSDGYDYGFHSRPVALTGSPSQGSGFATPDASNYYSTPFTDTALLAAGTANEWTYCGVAKAGLVSNGTLFSAEQSYDLGGFRAWLAPSGTYSPHMYDADGPSGSANPQIAAGADAGEFEFFAVSYSASQVKAYRKGNSTSMQTNTATPSPMSVTPSGLQFRIGRRTPNTSDAGGISIVGCGFYNRVLTPTEIEDEVYAKIKTFLAAQSYAINI